MKHIVDAQPVDDRRLDYQMKEEVILFALYAELADRLRQIGPSARFSESLAKRGFSKIPAVAYKRDTATRTDLQISVVFFC